MSCSRASKRKSSGEIITPTTQLGFACLPLSPAQLREIWAFDNECAAQMGAPLRTCSCVEEDNTGGVSELELSFLKDTIRDMWEKAKGVFEIFCDPNKQDLGFRLRVKPSLPIKVTLKTEDAFYLGWCSKAPAIDETPSSPCAHLYQRSPVYPLGYLGGPASYCNWETGKHATAKLLRPTNCSARYLVRLECRNLSAGTEVAWNYGCDKKMPVPGGSWFLEQCCSVSNERERRNEKKSNLVPFINVERCVLCGEAFPINNKESRVQRKPHFINSHADYLGSTWDALNKQYMQEEVDGLKVLTEADKLNYLIHTLSKDLNWKVIPACTVMSSAETKEYGEDSKGLCEEYRKRCGLLRAKGTLALRGIMALDHEPNLTPQHLQPIRPSVWKPLTWSKINGRPRKGYYGLPKNVKDEHTADLQSAVFNFCVTFL